MKLRKPAVAGTLYLAVAALVISASASARQTVPSDAAADGATRAVDNLPGPLTKEFEARKQAGLEKKLKGEARGKVAKLGKNKYVELVREKTDPVFVIIAEFGNARIGELRCGRHRSRAAEPVSVPERRDAAALRRPGAQRDRSAEPGDRQLDAVAGRLQPAHYQNMYFNRMAAYYQSQSSGRYTVEGDVTGWVKVPFNEARYGRDYCGGIVCNNTWFLIRDAMAFWVQGQLAAGRTQRRSRII